MALRTTVFGGLWEAGAVAKAPRCNEMENIKSRGYTSPVFFWKHAMNNAQCMLLGFVLCCLVVTMPGCSRYVRTEHVEGTVTYQGKPLAVAEIAFTPAVKGEGRPAFGMTDEHGKYKIQTMQGKADAGTTPGKYKVVLRKMESVKTGRKIPNPDGGTTEETVEKSVLPAFFASGKSTPITVDIVKGENIIDIDLDQYASGR